jgi:hypothetical protein
MLFTKGNLALRDHKRNGKRVFLFEQHKKGYVKFVSEVEVIDIDFFEAYDRSAALRISIQFFFKRKGNSVPYRPALISLAVDRFEPTTLYDPSETQKERFVNTRVGQGAYRKRIIHRWEYKCAVTGFDNLQVLVASHIVPWAQADDRQKLDVHNGILLSPTFDALFDRNLITFENSGRIILSNAIEKEAFVKIGITGIERIKNLSAYNHHYLDSHRSRFLSNE